MSNEKYTVGPSTPPPPTITIRANDNRPLLTIKPDGTVEGEIETASEAARLFVESLRDYLPKPTQSDNVNIRELRRLASIFKQWRSTLMLNKMDGQQWRSLNKAFDDLEAIAAQPIQTDVLKAAAEAIHGLLDITSEYNLDSEQATRALAALRGIGAALREQSK
jgi:RNase P/RNase MRP subunit p30